MGFILMASRMYPNCDKEFLIVNDLPMSVDQVSKTLELRLTLPTWIWKVPVTLQHDSLNEYVWTMTKHKNESP